MSATNPKVAGLSGWSSMRAHSAMPAATSGTSRISIRSNHPRRPFSSGNGTRGNQGSQSSGGATSGIAPTWRSSPPSRGSPVAPSTVNTRRSVDAGGDAHLRGAPSPGQLLDIAFDVRPEVGASHELHVDPERGPSRLPLHHARGHRQTGPTVEPVVEPAEARVSSNDHRPGSRRSSPSHSSGRIIGRSYRGPPTNGDPGASGSPTMRRRGRTHPLGRSPGRGAGRGHRQRAAATAPARASVTAATTTPPKGDPTANGTRAVRTARSTGPTSPTSRWRGARR